jgi:hypothetical protein
VHAVTVGYCSLLEHHLHTGVAQPVRAMEHTALPQRERREKRRRKPVTEEASTGALRLACAARPRRARRAAAAGCVAAHRVVAGARGGFVVRRMRCGAHDMRMPYHTRPAPWSRQGFRVWALKQQRPPHAAVEVVCAMHAPVYDARTSGTHMLQQRPRATGLTASVPPLTLAGAADAEAEGDAAAGEKVAAGPAERAARLSERLEAALAARRANQHSAAGGVKRRADGEELTTVDVDEPQPFNFECAPQTLTHRSRTLRGVCWQVPLRRRHHCSVVYLGSRSEAGRTLHTGVQLVCRCR